MLFMTYQCKSGVTKVFEDILYGENLIISSLERHALHDKPMQVQRHSSAFPNSLLHTNDPHKTIKMLKTVSEKECSFPNEQPQPDQIKP